MDFTDVRTVRAHVARLDASDRFQTLSTGLDDVLRQIANRGARKDLVAQAEAIQEEMQQLVEDHFPSSPPDTS